MKEKLILFQKPGSNKSFNSSRSVGQGKIHHKLFMEDINNNINYDSDYVIVERNYYVQPPFNKRDDMIPAA